MKSFTAIFLAVQVLLSSFSFSMGYHFCGGELVSSSLVGKASPCEHAGKNTSRKICPMHRVQDDGFSKKKCCQDEMRFVQGLDHQANPVNNAASQELTVQTFVAVLHVYFPIPSFSNLHFSKFQNYKPPLIERDLRVLVQSFLC